MATDTLPRDLGESGQEPKITPLGYEARVLYTFLPHEKENTEIFVSEGDVVSLQYEVGPWVFAKTIDGESGYIPKDFCSPLKGKQKRRLPKTPQNLNTKQDFTESTELVSTKQTEDIPHITNERKTPISSSESEQYSPSHSPSSSESEDNSEKKVGDVSGFETEKPKERTSCSRQSGSTQLDSQNKLCILQSEVPTEIYIDREIRLRSQSGSAISFRQTKTITSCVHNDSVVSSGDIEQHPLNITNISSDRQTCDSDLDRKLDSTDTTGQKLSQTEDEVQSDILGECSENKELSSDVADNCEDDCNKTNSSECNKEDIDKTNGYISPIELATVVDKAAVTRVCTDIDITYSNVDNLTAPESDSYNCEGASDNKLTSEDQIPNTSFIRDSDHELALDDHISITSDQGYKVDEALENQTKDKDSSIPITPASVNSCCQDTTEQSDYLKTDYDDSDWDSSSSSANNSHTENQSEHSNFNSSTDDEDQCKNLDIDEHKPSIADNTASIIDSKSLTLDNELAGNIVESCDVNDNQNGEGIQNKSVSDITIHEKTNEIVTDVDNVEENAIELNLEQLQQSSSSDIEEDIEEEIEAHTSEHHDSHVEVVNAPSPSISVLHKLDDNSCADISTDVTHQSVYTRDALRIETDTYILNKEEIISQESNILDTQPDIETLDLRESNDKNNSDSDWDKSSEYSNPTQSHKDDEHVTTPPIESELNKIDEKDNFLCEAQSSQELKDSTQEDPGRDYTTVESNAELHNSSASTETFELDAACDIADNENRNIENKCFDSSYTSSSKSDTDVSDINDDIEDLKVKEKNIKNEQSSELLRTRRIDKIIDNGSPDYSLNSDSDSWSTSSCFEEENKSHDLAIETNIEKIEVIQRSDITQYYAKLEGFDLEQRTEEHQIDSNIDSAVDNVTFSYTDSPKQCFSEPDEIIFCDVSINANHTSPNHIDLEDNLDIIVEEEVIPKIKRVNEISFKPLEFSVEIKPRHEEHSDVAEDDTIESDASSYFDSDSDIEIIDVEAEYFRKAPQEDNQNTIDTARLPSPDSFTPNILSPIEEVDAPFEADNQQEGSSKPDNPLQQRTESFDGSDLFPSQREVESLTDFEGFIEDLFQIPQDVLIRADTYAANNNVDLTSSPVLDISRECVTIETGPLVVDASSKERLVTEDTLISFDNDREGNYSYPPPLPNLFPIYTSEVLPPLPDSSPPTLLDSPVLDISHEEVTKEIGSPVVDASSKERFVTEDTLISFDNDREGNYSPEVLPPLPDSSPPPLLDSCSLETIEIGSEHILTPQTDPIVNLDSDLHQIDVLSLDETVISHSCSTCVICEQLISQWNLRLQNFNVSDQNKADLELKGFLKVLHDIPQVGLDTIALCNEQIKREKSNCESIKQFNFWLGSENCVYAELNDSCKRCIFIKNTVEHNAEKCNCQKCDVFTTSELNISENIGLISSEVNDNNSEKVSGADAMLDISLNLTNGSYNDEHVLSISEYNEKNMVDVSQKSPIKVSPRLNGLKVDADAVDKIVTQNGKLGTNGNLSNEDVTLNNNNNNVASSSITLNGNEPNNASEKKHQLFLGPDGKMYDEQQYEKDATGKTEIPANGLHYDDGVDNNVKRDPGIVNISNGVAEISIDSVISVRVLQGTSDTPQYKENTLDLINSVASANNESVQGNVVQGDVPSDINQSGEPKDITPSTFSHSKPANGLDTSTGKVPNGIDSANRGGVNGISDSVTTQRIKLTPKPGFRANMIGIGGRPRVPLLPNKPAVIARRVRPIVGGVTNSNGAKCEPETVTRERVTPTVISLDPPISLSNRILARRGPTVASNRSNDKPDDKDIRQSLQGHSTLPSPRRVSNGPLRARHNVQTDSVSKPNKANPPKILVKKFNKQIWRAQNASPEGDTQRPFSPFGGTLPPSKINKRKVMEVFV